MCGLLSLRTTATLESLREPAVRVSEEREERRDALNRRSPPMAEIGTGWRGWGSGTPQYNLRRPEVELRYPALGSVRRQMI
jgi:hypothetical protein